MADQMVGHFSYRGDPATSKQMLGMTIYNKPKAYSPKNHFGRGNFALNKEARPCRQKTKIVNDEIIFVRSEAINPQHRLHNPENHFGRGNFALNKEASPHRQKTKIVNDEIIFVRSEATNPQQTLHNPENHFGRGNFALNKEASPQHTRRM